MLADIGSNRPVLLFLAGYWLYIDGVNTIIVMAVDYGLSLGFDKSTLIIALLITQFVGFPAAIGFGKVGEKLGTKNGIFIAIAVYIGVCVWGYFMKREVGVLCAGSGDRPRAGGRSIVEQIVLC